MTAPRLALSTALALLPVPALGQGFSHPPGLSPSVTPAMIRPAAFGPQYRGYGRSILPGPFNYGYGYGGYGYYPAPFGDYGYAVPGLFTPLAPGLSTVPPPLQGTAPTAVDSAAASLDMPAAGEVTFEFPAEVALTVDGVPVPGAGRERTITSGPLRPGEEARLAVRATWAALGKQYEWDRVVTVGRGGRSRVTVARGFAAK